MQQEHHYVRSLRGSQQNSAMRSSDQILLSSRNLIHSLRKAETHSKRLNITLEKPLIQTTTVQNEKSNIFGKSTFKAFRNKMLVSKFKEKLMTLSYIHPRDPHQQKFLQESYINSIEGHISTVKPQSLFMKVIQNDAVIFYWDMVSLLFSFVISWYAPYYVSFGESNNYIEKLLQFIIIGQLTTDLFINMNRPVIINGKVIHKRRSIIKHYYTETRHGMFDSLLLVFWVLSFSLVFNSHSLECIIGTFGTVFCIERLYQKIIYYQESTYITGIWKDIKDLLNLIITIFYYAHVTSCIWHYVGNNTLFLGSTWLTQFNIYDETKPIKYVYSFYWATMTMTTIGYGDIVAVNHLEMIIACIIMFLSTCIFGYAMQSIGLILSNINESQKKYKEQISLINGYMSKYKVNIILQNRARNVLKAIHSQVDNNDHKAQQIIEELPKSLQTDLNEDIKLQIIRKMKVFSKYSASIQDSLAQVMEIVQFLPQETIYKQDEFNDFLYFIVSGLVVESEIKSGFQFKKMIDNSVFGQYQFFSGFTPRTTAINIGYSTICKISRSQFLAILQLSDRDKQQFLEVCDQVKFRDYLSIDLPCNICNKYYHLNVDCPKIQYKPYLETLVKRENFCYNLRNWIPRRTFKINARSHLREISDINLEDSRTQEIEQIREYDSALEVSQVGQMNWNKQHTDEHIEVSQSNQNSLIPSDMDVQQVPQLISKIQIHGTDYLTPLMASKKRIDSNRNFTIEKSRHRRRFTHDHKDEVSIGYTQPEFQRLNMEQNHLSLATIIISPSKYSQNEQLQIDKLHNFEFYFPLYNASRVVLKIRNKVKNLYPIISRYMFKYAPRLFKSRNSYKSTKNIIFTTFLEQ